MPGIIKKSGGEWCCYLVGRDVWGLGPWGIACCWERIGVSAGGVFAWGATPGLVGARRAQCEIGGELGVQGLGLPAGREARFGRTARGVGWARIWV